MHYLVLPECSKVLTRKSDMFRPVKSNNVSVVFWILCQRRQLLKKWKHWKNEFYDIISPYKLIWWVCQQTVADLHIQLIRSNIGIHLKSNFWPPDECNTNIHSPLSYVLNRLSINLLIFRSWKKSKMTTAFLILSVTVEFSNRTVKFMKLMKPLCEYIHPTDSAPYLVKH